MDPARKSALAIPLRRVGSNSWTDEQRSCWLRTGPGRCFSLRLVGSTRSSLRGLRCGSRLWMRDSAHRLLRAIVRFDGPDQLSIEALRWVEPPPVGPRRGSDVHVLYAPNAGSFRSQDGRLVGRAQPSLGRLSATWTGEDGRQQRYEGLWGRGVVVLVDESGRSSVHAVSAEADGSYRVHGFAVSRRARAPARIQIEV